MIAQSQSILFLNQHYYPDLAATAQNLTDLCEHLADEGREVHVISSRGMYHTKGDRLPKYQVHNGVHIHRVGGTSFGRDHNLGRVLDYATFMILALIKLIRLQRFDVVSTLTTPPMLATLGTFIRGLKGSKHIIWSMDLHPDAEVALGMLKEDYWLTDLLVRLHRYNQKKADAIISLGNYMTKRIMDYGVDASKIKEINIWSNKNDIEVEHKEDCLHTLPEHFKNRFIVQYSGNLGLVHEFETMLQVIKSFADDDSIGFVFNGEGPRKQQVAEFVVANNLKNVALLTYVPMRRLSTSMGKADLHWFSLREEFVGMAVPGKSIGYMASGRPVIFIGPQFSDNGETIAAANCGFVVDFHKTEKIRDIILKLKDNPELRSMLGHNGRRWFENNAETSVSCEIWSDTIDSLFYSQYQLAYA